MQTPYLVGSIVYLRPLERADVPVVQPWLNEPDMTRTLLFHRPMNAQAVEDLVARSAQPDTVVLGVVATKPDRLVGLAGLTEIDTRSRHASFMMLIARVEWGRGYGREAMGLAMRLAFDTLNLHRVWLRVLEDHEPALRLAERSGFTREGVLRESHFREGRYCNTVVMGLLRDEWRRRDSP